MASSLNIPPHVGSCLKRALSLHDRGDAAGALEAIAAGAVADIQQHQQAFLGDVRACGMLGEFAGEILRGADFGTLCDAGQNTCGNTTGRRNSQSDAASAISVLYVVPNLAQGQAASANLLRLVESHLRSSTERGSDSQRPTLDVRVIVCDEFTARTPPLAFLQYPQAASEDVGTALLAKLRTLVPVHVLSTRGTFLDAAKEALGVACNFKPDVALFMGNLSCPIQTALAFARIAPKQVCINLGVPLVVRGIDAVIYNNTSKQQRDTAVLERAGIRVLGVETSGGDAAAGALTQPLPRRELGVPEDAVVAVSVSNRLAHRMLAGHFAKHLGAFLRDHPSAWWIGVGPGEPQPVLDLIRNSGGENAARRCVFVGPHGDVCRVVKACDVFLNEYPEGGGNSVIEAMGCGVPVVAMRAGERHAECIGAELVGEDAIVSHDANAYWALVHEWTSNLDAARQAGRRQQRRALERLDYSVICKAYEECVRAICSRLPLESTTRIG